MQHASAGLLLAAGLMSLLLVMAIVQRGSHDIVMLDISAGHFIMGACRIRTWNTSPSLSWDDVPAFVEWMNQAYGPGWCLPSQAEREYACRAGGRHEYWGAAMSMPWPGMTATAICIITRWHKGHPMPGGCMT